MSQSSGRAATVPVLPMNHSNNVTKRFFSLRHPLSNRTRSASGLSMHAFPSPSLRGFLIALITLSVASACIENGLHPATLLTLPLVIAALLRRDYDRPLWSERLTVTGFFLYLVLATLGIWLFARETFLPVFVVYFTFGTLLARVVSRLSRRNVGQLIFLTVGLVLINCILTNHMLFGLVLPVYLFTLMCTLVLFQASGSRSFAEDLVRPALSPKVCRPLYRAFARATLVILVVTAVAFVILPRPFVVIPGLRSSISPGGAAELAQQISYRDMVDMAGRQRIAFTAEVESGTLPDFPYWRGRVLEKTDGRTWSQGKEIAEVRKLFDPKPSEVVNYRVTPYKLHSSTVYACTTPTHATGRGDQPLHITNRGEVIVDSPFLFSDSYSVDSVKLPVPALRRDTALNVSQEGITPRIGDLARRWTRGLTSPRDMALALVSRLEKDFHYSLRTPPPPAEVHPIEYFLFQTKAGHCEYFAGALALMLRSLDIPARVVEGFAGAEPTDNPNQVVVRFARAHAWVEAILDGAVWTQLDPVPPSRSAGLLSEMIMGIIQDFYDRMDRRWTKHVIYFDRSDQARIFERLSETFSDIEISWLSDPAMGQIGGIGGALVIAVLIGALLMRRSRLRHRDPAEFYLATMTALVRKGVLREIYPWHEDNVSEIQLNSPGSTDALLRFMEIYLRGRFGNGSAEARKDLRKAGAALVQSVPAQPVRSYGVHLERHRSRG
ncbi:MAG: DUF3488 domain-containing protein [Desulfomonile tiedjei]|nr:DUF3488 domain-containing protein [Desulfomonile tiedjei]